MSCNNAQIYVFKYNLCFAHKNYTQGWNRIKLEFVYRMKHVRNLFFYFCAVLQPFNCSLLLTISDMLCHENEIPQCIVNSKSTE